MSFFSEYRTVFHIRWRVCSLKPKLSIAALTAPEFSFLLVWFLNMKKASQMRVSSVTSAELERFIRVIRALICVTRCGFKSWIKTRFPMVFRTGITDVYHKIIVLVFVWNFCARCEFCREFGGRNQNLSSDIRLALRASRAHTGLNSAFLNQ